MARGSTAAWLVAAGLLTSWAVSSASDETRKVALTPVRAEAPRSHALRAVEGEVARLMARPWRPGPALPVGRRNPFAFARAVRPESRPPVRGSADTPAPAPPIALTGHAPPRSALSDLALAGIAHVRGRGAIAVVSFDGALHYMLRGGVIANRYRIDAIGDRAIEIFDLVLGTKSRLILQRP